LRSSSSASRSCRPSRPSSSPSSAAPARARPGRRRPVVSRPDAGADRYLRQQLLLVLGAVDVAFACVVFAYGGLDKAVTQGFACALLFEGAVFIADAVLRKRAPKPRAKAA